VSEQAYLKRKIGRIRDVAVASDGSILLLSDEANGGVYRLYR
jgi:glucose/arabinose dehydrogenase